MHDPTERGVATALCELAEAGRALTIDPRAVRIPPLAARLCKAFNLDPLGAIASGALLLSASASDAPQICHALAAAGIACTAIGEVTEGPPAVWHMGTIGREPFPRPGRDAIAQVYEG
jgi:hydrogenase maturation factor